MRTPTLSTAALRRAAALLRSATDEFGPDALALLCAAARAEDRHAEQATEAEEGCPRSEDDEAEADDLWWDGLRATAAEYGA